MPRFDVFTLVPEAFAWFLEQHPVRDAVRQGLAEVRVHDIRAFTPLSHATVDDTPYGGGPGMVLRVDVIAAALEGVFGGAAEEVKLGREVYVLGPGGRPFDDAGAGALAESDRDVVLLCGRYEGFDARVFELFATEEISVGPYVLAGGEAAALIVLEASIRKIPGVLGNVGSLEQESFGRGLDGAAEYPHYTRPRDFRGHGVPEVLLSGNHGEIERWRLEHAREPGWGRWAPRGTDEARGG